MSNCPNCQRPVFVEPQYKDHLCKNKSCSLYLKGDVFKIQGTLDSLAAPLMGINNSETKINEIMNNFDFYKVNNVMGFLNWTWAFKGVPSVTELRTTARKMLQECFDKSKNNNSIYSIGTGGFVASYDPSDSSFSLRFELDEWTAE